MEQATRVCVGVRAVIERAIVENMSVVVEGVHLLPGLVPFRDLDGAVHQILLTLTTLSEETHRARFLARSRAAPRAAERYLENYTAIRRLQSQLIEQAEAHDTPLFDTSDGESSLPRALRLVTGLLEEKLPWLGRSDDARTRQAGPVLLLAIDGVADRPARALGDRTPLEAARLPNLDRLAREGRTGLADPVAPGVVPDTAVREPRPLRPVPARHAARAGRGPGHRHRARPGRRRPARQLRHRRAQRGARRPPRRPHPRREPPSSPPPSTA